MTLVVYIAMTFVNFIFNNNKLSGTQTTQHESFTYPKFDPEIFVDEKEKVYVDEVIYNNLRATVYHAVQEQTDNTPFITADNSFIDTAKVNDLRWIAISRDLVNLKTPKYNFKGKLKLGDTVWISYNKDEIMRIATMKKYSPQRIEKVLKKYDQIVGWWVVKDTMGDYHWQVTEMSPKAITDEMMATKQYKIQKGVVYKKHYQRKWIDFLQHPKTGMLDYWNKNVIITKRKLVEDNAIDQSTI